MDLFEYQARELLEDAGVRLPPGQVITSANEAGVLEFNFPVVVKAQVQVGSRGKAGGILLVNDNLELENAARRLLGSQIKGHSVDKLLIVPAVDIVAEYYAAIVFNRKSLDYNLVISRYGGVEIETVAASDADSVKIHAFSSRGGLTTQRAQEFLVEDGFQDAEIDELAEILAKLWSVYETNDATIVEVNPLALVKLPDENRTAFMALDAKISLDNNAAFRHRELFEKFKYTKNADKLEMQAQELNINYVRLNGEVGIIGNGAGLVMSTLDIVELVGNGEVHPANFLDIGGGASADKMQKSLEIVLRDKNVQVVLINIFGGLTQCDLVAQGIITTLNNMRTTDYNLVVRFDGNRAAEGLKMLKNAQNPHIICVKTMSNAAKTAVAFVRDKKFTATCEDTHTQGPELVHAQAHSSPETGFSSSNLPDVHTGCIVQGITGSQGLLHTERMLQCGTRILGGVNPRKAGKILELESKSGVVEVPVFASVREAVRSTGSTTSVVFVPPAYAKDAVLEAVESGIKLVIVITEGIAQRDAIEFKKAAEDAGVQIIGPNCPGITVFPSNAADKKKAVSCNLGIIPDGISGPGSIGLVSKSGTLTYQMMALLSDIGFTAAVGIGGDLCIGTSHIDMIKKFEDDPNTKLIVMIGEIGGNLEQDAAEYIKEHVTKKVVAYIAGVTAPEGKTMGHAGAIIQNGQGGAKQKREVLEKAGVLVANTPEEAAELARGVLKC